MRLFIILIVTFVFDSKLAFSQQVVKPFIMFLDDKIIYSSELLHQYTAQNIKSTILYRPGSLIFDKKTYDSIVDYSDSLNLIYKLDGVNNSFVSNDRIVIKLRLSYLNNYYFLLYIYTREGKLRRKSFRGNRHKYYYEVHSPGLNGYVLCDPL